MGGTSPKLQMIFCIPNIELYLRFEVPETFDVTLPPTKGGIEFTHF